ncbi:MAG: nucleotidyltransferase [Flavobacteriaceae bacterium]|nr:nucleotidyltransferase [Flavobacteriaceae bacterium]
MNDSLIILAGGASSRMKNPAKSVKISVEEVKQANQRSKSLIGIGPENRPFLDFLLTNAKEAGYKNIFLIVGKDNKLFREYYGQKDRGNNYKGLTISYAIQHIPEFRVKPFGTADALRQCLEQYPDLIEHSFSVCNSDNLYSIKALNAIAELDYPNGFISYDRESLQFNSERIKQFALAKLDEHNYLMDIIEKPKENEVEEFRDNYGKLRVSMNLFKFKGKYIYPFVKNCPVNPNRNEKELQTAILNMLRKYPKSMIGIPLAEHVPDLTSKDDINTIKEYIKKYR